jgi:glycosyltransferase involved in cell wall biosynthesis
MDKSNIDFIYFTGDNGIDYPKGGITSFTRQMMNVFGNRMALVGISTDNSPVGKWITKELDGKSYLFFSIARVDKNLIKPFIPQRLSGYLKLKKYKNKILELDVPNAFVQNSHFLLAINNWNLPNKAYIFHGATNPLEKPRYPFAKLLASAYEKVMFQRLRSYNTIFAAADDNEIKNLVKRSGNLISNKKIIKLPTRFDHTVFFPANKEESMKALNLERDRFILVHVGRISKQKGCDFLIESFHLFLKNHPGSVLYFVGDGEEKANLTLQIKLT